MNANDEHRVLELLKASAEAWNRGDLSGHLALYAPSVTVMTAEGPRPTIEALELAFAKAYFVEGHATPQLTLDKVTVRPLSGQSALTTGRFRLSGTNLADRTGWFTLVWQETLDGWRVVHDHSA